MGQENGNEGVSREKQSVEERMRRKTPKGTQKTVVLGCFHLSIPVLEGTFILFMLYLRYYVQCRKY